MIYLWTRSTLDWQDEEAFWRQLRPELLEPVRLWNRSFRLPFHLFRHRLRQLSLANLREVRGAELADWDAIPEGALVVPIDDDDWLAPDLAEQLAAVSSPEWQAYRWISGFLEVPTTLRHELGLVRRRWLSETPPRHLFHTNNYAMPKTAENAPLLGRHTLADRHFKAGALPRVRYLNASASLMNRTMASTTTLWSIRGVLGPLRLALKERRYRRLYSGPVPNELAWSAPYRDAMAQLMREL